MLRRSARLVPLLLFVPLLALTLVGPAAPPAAGQAAEQSYLFCFWNVENLFDDHNDKRGKADEPYDTWFARDRKALDLKLAHLCQALLKMNQSKGPDILAVIEVESLRAAELLQQALNKRLKDPKLHYKHVLMKNLVAGRHIAPAILTRLPARPEKTKLHGKQQRILEGHVHVGNRELVILATHWTSRLTDETGEARGRYADRIHDAYEAMYSKDRKVDLLICGDFNDPPNASSVVKHLHATGDAKAVLKPHNPPLLYNLLAGKDHNVFGTHYYRGWWIFDQIVVSPGMLDQQGWSCDPKTLHVENSLHRPNDAQRRPWRFGDEDDKGERGFSDHFPVTVRLKVHGK